MKNFSKFLEEVTIKGNSGVPGESGPNKRNEPQYLNNKEQSAKRRLGVTGREGHRDIGMMGQEMMGILNRSMGMMAGKETELEELAERVIRANYESILDNVELDIKLLRPGRVKEFMDEEEDPDQPEPPNYKEVNDPEIRKHVDKAKLLNNIIQGEAKNTKNMLHLPEVKDGLVEIFGERQATEVFNMWVRITTLADKMDWIIPIDIKANLLEEQPEGMAGAVKIDWKKDEEKEEKEIDIDKLLKSIEENGVEENEEEIAEVFNNGTPIIKARGVDFPMLLHETVKGIYELLAAASLPAEDASKEEIRTAEIAKLNTSSFADEAEDFRYGPEIAADLRDFVNKLPNINKLPNMRERVFAKMVDRNLLSVDEFLNLMKGILSNKDTAVSKMNELVNMTIKEMDDYEKANSKWELGEVIGHEDDDDISNIIKNSNYDDEDDSDLADPDNERPESETDKLIRQSSEKPKEDPNDFSKLGQRDLQIAINKALDDEDYELVGKLSKYLKENKVYLRELERINEGLNPHTK